MKVNGVESVRALGKAWLLRILDMHMSAASMKTVAAATSPCAERRLRRYLSRLP